MKGKIPVGGTIAHAYGFAFGNIVNNLGAVWIVVAIMWALTYFFQGAYIAAMMNAGDPRTVVQAMPFLFGTSLVSIVVVSAMMAAITKEALGLRSGNAFLQFPFGGAMWRTLASYVLFFLVMLLLYVLFVIATLIVAGASAMGMRTGSVTPILGLIVGLLFLAGLCAFFFVAVRLSFLMVPVAVAERVSLIRAWQLTSGNFWRIFVILIALILPFLIAEIALLGFLMQGTATLSTDPSASEAQALLAQRQAMNLRMMRAMQRYWYVVQPVGLVISLIFYGLLAGASAHAYRAVTHEDHAPEVF